MTWLSTSVGAMPCASVITLTVGAVKSGVKKLVNWWKKKVPVNFGEEKHTLTFEGEDKNAKLVLRSIPEKPSTFLDNAGEKKGVDAPKRKKPVDTAKEKEAKVTTVLESLKKIDESSKTASGKESEKADKLSQQLDTKLADLATHLVGTLGKWGVADDKIKDVKLPREKYMSISRSLI